MNITEIKKCTVCDNEHFSETPLCPDCQDYGQAVVMVFGEIYKLPNFLSCEISIDAKKTVIIIKKCGDEYETY